MVSRAVCKCAWKVSFSARCSARSSRRSASRRNPSLRLVGCEWLGVDVDHGIKTDRAADRDVTVDAGKVPTSWHQTTVEMHGVRAADREQQAQFVVNGTFGAADFVSPEAKHWDQSGRINRVPLHVDHGELAQQGRRLE